MKVNITRVMLNAIFIVIFTGLVGTTLLTMIAAPDKQMFYNIIKVDLFVFLIGVFIDRAISKSTSKKELEKISKKTYKEDSLEKLVRLSLIILVSVIAVVAIAIKFGNF